MSGASVEDQDWLALPSTRAVMAALEAAGGEGCARFVGGCVRNALMGQAVDDIDIATRLEPEATMTAIQAAGLKAVPTGLAHGTVTAVAERRPYEITTLRRDVTTDGRNATVAFTDSWSEDAARRDFRLNALYADAAGQVFDPTGQGVADAAAGRIVFVGDPTTRIREDYLRILRFFRFFAWYGRGAPDAVGLAACAAEAGGMSRLSAERVSKELLKLLAAPDPRPSMRAMAGAGVVAQVLPEADALALFEAMAEVEADPALRLSALLPADPATVTAASARLRLPNALRDRLVEAVSGALPVDASPAQVRAALYRDGRRAALDRLARAQAETGRSPERAALAVAQDWPIPRLPVGGREAGRLGLSGPDVGLALKAFEDAWVAADFPDHGHEARLKAAVSALAPRG